MKTQLSSLNPIFVESVMPAYNESLSTQSGSIITFISSLHNGQEMDVDMDHTHRFSQTHASGPIVFISPGSRLSESRTNIMGARSSWIPYKWRDMRVHLNISGFDGIPVCNQDYCVLWNSRRAHP